MGEEHPSPGLMSSTISPRRDPAFNASAGAMLALPTRIRDAYIISAFTTGCRAPIVAGAPSSCDVLPAAAALVIRDAFVTTNTPEGVSGGTVGDQAASSGTAGGTAGHVASTRATPLLCPQYASTDHPLNGKYGPCRKGTLFPCTITCPPPYRWASAWDQGIVVSWSDCHESGGTGKRKREAEAPVQPIASSSRTTLNSIEDGEVDEGRTHKKVRRGKRSGRLVREYEQRKAERANKTEGVVNERDEESEMQAHLESVLQTVAEVAEAEDALAIAWDGEVAPAWVPEKDENDAGPAKM
ncbi:hypothetical protein B0H16DRAFT_1481472 [Mycena metata]|uniref:Uncharacterized protein n=1 Tax=Mycena metata TaxID=1033252 RepID=A0AAD7MAI7_9AGAR|nr:hypothetical protein B0H16DRAFT_1481472 [Mycena metata]